MQEERGQIVGDQVVSRGIDLWGSIVGNVSVVKGGKMYIRGNVYGDLTVSDGGRVHIFGNITGNLTIKEGAKVIHGGVVGRNIVNDGGRLFIEANAKVLGKLKTKDGETTIAPDAQVEGA
jgi:cytoskeletal protein CcmA (bactofilin family)